jgi:hypothetical protein
MGGLSDLLVRKHSAIATTLFASSFLGSLVYTISTGKSAYNEYKALITGECLFALSVTG